MCTLDCHVICYHLVCQLPIVIYIPVTIWRQVSNQPINIQLGIKRSNSHNSTAAVRNKDKKKYGIISFSLKKSVTSLPTLIMSAVCMFVVWLARKLHFHGFSSRQYSCMTVEINENEDKTPSSCPSVGWSFCGSFEGLSFHRSACINFLKWSRHGPWWWTDPLGVLVLFLVILLVILISPKEYWWA